MRHHKQFWDFMWEAYDKCKTILDLIQSHVKTSCQICMKKLRNSHGINV